jgi:diguanylate cyclase (GGDEF)-like protein/PAS domain S-box-containing protein
MEGREKTMEGSLWSDEHAGHAQAEKKLRLLEGALAVGSNGVIVTDAGHEDAPVIYASEGFGRVTGRDAALTLGRGARSALGLEKGQRGVDDLYAAVHDGREWEGVLRARRESGAVLYARISVSRVDGEGGETVWTIEDVTERVRVEEALRVGEGRFRRIVEQAADALILHDRQGIIVDANRSACEALGYEREELLGMDMAQIESGVPAESLAKMWRRMKPGEPLALDGTYRRKDGTTFPVDVRVGVFESGEKPLLLALARDVTQRRQSEETLRRSERLFRRLFEQAADALILHDSSGRIVDCNEEVCRSLGYARPELLGRSMRDIVVFPGAAGEAPTLWHGAAGVPGRRRLSRDGEGVLAGEYRRKDGRTFPVEVGVSIVEYGGEPLFLASARDLTERQRLERMTRLALHDPLTDLPNRTLLVERLEHALARLYSERGTDAKPRHVALLFLDVDNFKVVNDSLGHPTGDRLLIEIAARLKGSLRLADTAARIGGDEFVILLEDVAGPSEAIRVATRIIEGFQAPILLDGRELFAKVSVGISVGSGNQGGRVSGAENLLREADIAMYGAKRRGKNRYEVFDPSMGERAIYRLKVETELRCAAASPHEHFEIHYQPKMRLKTGDLAGFEALLRWRHPERGRIQPAAFIPVAEETGLIVPIGRWVLEEACRRAAEWCESWRDDQHEGRGPDAGPPKMSVNLSAGQFRRPGLVEEVAGALAVSGLEAGLLELEITESVAMHDADVMLKRFEELKALGVRLAIDDFGTGYSSMNYLEHLPVDLLKIDRSFVERLGRDPEAPAIVSAMVHLAHALDLQVVAEGVETAEQLRRLRELDSDYVQGYFYARPLPVDGVAAFLARERDA